MAPMTVSALINNLYISKEPSLSTKVINSTSTAIFIVLYYSLSPINTAGQSYQLQIILNSTDLNVQNAYNAIPNITINVINATQLIGNPEGKDPILNSLT
jgi:hypothetical protein